MCNSQNVPDSLILKGPSISHIINTTVKKERKCVRTFHVRIGFESLRRRLRDMSVHVYALYQDTKQSNTYLFIITFSLKPFSFDLLQIFSLKFRGLASDTNNVSVKSNTILSTASYICCPEFQRQMQL